MTSITDEETPTPTCQRELVGFSHLTSDIVGMPSSCFYEAMMALALILIDGGTAHLLKAAYIYLLGLYICTNSNCFVQLVLGLLP